MGQETVKFAGRLPAICGVFAGVIFALGITVATLALGQHLNSGIQLTIIILALFGGGIISTVSAFFGLVMPTSIAESSAGCTQQANVTEPSADR